MSDGPHVLCVCTWNRTRSVLMQGLLARCAADAGLTLTVTSAGTRASGTPATVETVRRLERIDVDATAHLSRRLDASLVSAADLILTAEQQHVVTIATLVPAAFDRTFAMPEFVTRATTVGPRRGRAIGHWLSDVNRERPRSVEYLDSTVGEVRDPTGCQAPVWDQVVDEIGRLAGQSCALLS